MVTLAAVEVTTVNNITARVSSKLRAVQLVDALGRDGHIVVHLRGERHPRLVGLNGQQIDRLEDMRRRCKVVLGDAID